MNLLTIPSIVGAIDELLFYHDKITIIGGKNGKNIRKHGMINSRYQTISYNSSVSENEKVVILLKGNDVVEKTSNISGVVMVREFSSTSIEDMERMKGVYTNILLSTKITHLYWHHGNGGKKPENLMKIAYGIFQKTLRTLCGMRPSSSENDSFCSMIEKYPSYPYLCEMFEKQGNFITWDTTSALRKRIEIPINGDGLKENIITKSILKGEKILY